MKTRLLAITSLLFLTLSGCQFESAWFNTQKEATEAVNNLKEEATTVHDNVTTKIDQIQQAAESVGDAADAFNQAVEDVKVVTGGTETEEINEEDEAVPEEN